MVKQISEREKYTVSCRWGKLPADFTNMLLTEVSYNDKKLNFIYGCEDIKFLRRRRPNNLEQSMKAALKAESKCHERLDFIRVEYSKNHSKSVVTTGTYANEIAQEVYAEFIEMFLEEPSGINLGACETRNVPQIYAPLCSLEQKIEGTLRF